MQFWNETRKRTGGPYKVKLKSYEVNSRLIVVN